MIFPFWILELVRIYYILKFHVYLIYDCNIVALCISSMEGKIRSPRWYRLMRSLSRKFHVYNPLWSRVYNINWKDKYVHIHESPGKKEWWNEWHTVKKGELKWRKRLEIIPKFLWGNGHTLIAALAFELNDAFSSRCFRVVAFVRLTNQYSPRVKSLSFSRRG